MGELSVGEEVRRVRTLASVYFEICNRYLRYWGSLKATVGFDIPIGTSGSHMSLLPKGLLLWTDGNQFYKSLSFSLTARNPPMVHVELISGYLNCLWSLRNRRFFWRWKTVLSFLGVALIKFLISWTSLDRVEDPLSSLSPFSCQKDWGLTLVFISAPSRCPDTSTGWLYLWGAATVTLVSLTHGLGGLSFTREGMRWDYNSFRYLEPKMPFIFTQPSLPYEHNRVPNDSNNTEWEQLVILCTPPSSFLSLPRNWSHARSAVFGAVVLIMFPATGMAPEFLPLPETDWSDCVFRPQYHWIVSSQVRP